MTLREKIRKALDEGDSYDWGEGGFVDHFDKEEATDAVMKVIVAEYPQEKDDD